MHRCSWSIAPLGASVRWTPDRTIARRASPRGSGVPFSIQSFTATKHTGSEGTRDMLSKNKKRTRNIKKKSMNGVELSTSCFRTVVCTTRLQQKSFNEIYKDLIHVICLGFQKSTRYMLKGTEDHSRSRTVINPVINMISDELRASVRATAASHEACSTPSTRSMVAGSGQWSAAEQATLDRALRECDARADDPSLLQRYAAASAKLPGRSIRDVAARVRNLRVLLHSTLSQQTLVPPSNPGMQYWRGLIQSFFRRGSPVRRTRNPKAWGWRRLPWGRSRRRRAYRWRRGRPRALKRRGRAPWPCLSARAACAPPWSPTGRSLACPGRRPHLR